MFLCVRKDKSKKDKAPEKSRGVVTVPYVHSFAEKIQRIFTKHRVATEIKPQTTLRQVLVHPKDTVEKQKKGWSGVQNSMQPMRKGIYR